MRTVLAWLRRRIEQHQVNARAQRYKILDAREALLRAELVRQGRVVEPWNDT